MVCNGEVIYGMWFWCVYGEGLMCVSGGMFSEGNVQLLMFEDICFIIKGGVFYVIVLGWFKDGLICIWILVEDLVVVFGFIDCIEVVGFGDSLLFKCMRWGLEIKLFEGLVGLLVIVVKICGVGVV